MRCPYCFLVHGLGPAYVSPKNICTRGSELLSFSDKTWLQKVCSVVYVFFTFAIVEYFVYCSTNNHLPSPYWLLITLSKHYYHCDSLYSYLHQILHLCEKRCKTQRWQSLGRHVGWVFIGQEKINTLYHRLECTCVDVMSLKPVTNISPNLIDPHKNHKFFETLPADI